LYHEWQKAGKPYNIDLRTRMNKIKLLYASLLIYTVLVLAGGLVNYFFNPYVEPNIIPVAIRFLAVLVFTFGLYQKQKWAYWPLVIFTGIFSAFGIIGRLGLLMTTDYKLLALIGLLMTIPLVSSFLLLINPVMKRYYVK
jgi:hypothetical protein